MKWSFAGFAVTAVLGFWFLQGEGATAQENPAPKPEATVSGEAIAPDQVEVPAALTKATEAVVRAMNGKECEKAFDFMTPKGESEFLGDVLMQCAGFAQEDGGLGEVPDGIKKLQDIAEDLGLDEVPMPPLGPEAGSSGPDEIVKLLSDYREKLLACIPEKERRARVLEVRELMNQAFVSPMSFGAGAIDVNGDRADVSLVMKLDPDFAEQGGDDMALPMGGDEEQVVNYLIFVKQDGAWKFDGSNVERAMSEMAPSAKPFEEIENLDIEGQTLDDTAISLTDYKDKVVLVDFWGTWCGPCVASLPKLSELHARYKERGFEILGVAADDADTLGTFLEKNPLTWKHVVDADSEIAAEYGIEAFPTTLLIDRQGKHVATDLHGESLEKAIELLLEGKTIESINGSAEDLLAAGKKRAEAEGKLVFLHFGADWCGPCKALEKWMAQPEIHDLLSPVFVDVRIDMDRNYGAQQLIGGLTEEAGGIPWYAIVKPGDSKPLITSDAATIGNIGLPGDAESQAHFVRMFESTGRFSKEQLELLRGSIQKAAAGYVDKSE